MHSFCVDINQPPQDPLEPFVEWGALFSFSLFIGMVFYRALVLCGI